MQRRVSLWFWTCVFFVVLMMGAAAKADNVFLLPQSGTVYLTDADVAGFSAQKLNYARNEVFARYGRLFNSRELMDYFGLQSWYRGSVMPEQFSNSWLNEYEKVNVEFLLAKEKAIISGGYPLDQPGYNIYAVYNQGPSVPAAPSPQPVAPAPQQPVQAPASPSPQPVVEGDGLNENWYYITSKYQKGIALHPAPDPDTETLTRLPYMTVFSGTDMTGTYVYTWYNDCWGWVNTKYAKRIAAPEDYGDSYLVDSCYRINSTYQKGIAVHPKPDKNSDVIGRLPYMTEFFVYAGVGDYGFTIHEDMAGWVNLNYAEWVYDLEDDGSWEDWDIIDDEDEADPPSGMLSEDDACAAMQNYMDINYNMDTVYRNHGWFVYAEYADDTYQFLFKSEDGEYATFYVYPDTWEIYVEWEDADTGSSLGMEYLGNAQDYL